VVKHVYAAELRVVVAVVLAVAADAVLVAQHLLKPGTHLVTAPGLHVHNLARRRALGVGGRGREIFPSATCSLQFANARAATLSQQEKNDTADVQRGRVNISGFIGAVVS
jgi:hypothetical protein